MVKPIHAVTSIKQNTRMVKPIHAVTSIKQDTRMVKPIHAVTSIKPGRQVTKQLQEHNIIVFYRKTKQNIDRQKYIGRS
jgi:hypothetical protein